MLRTASAKHENFANAVFLLFLDVGRVGGVAAAGFLHGALDGVFGVFPVGVFELVVEFFLEPFHVAGDPFEVLDHLGEEDFAEAGLVFFVQIALCTGERSPKWGRQKPFPFFRKSMNSSSFRLKSSKKVARYRS